MVTKEEILDYTTNTPENTNRNVLSSMLNEYGSGGSGEGPLLVNIVYENPSTQTKGPLRVGAGPWLDAASLDIFTAAQTRGVIVHEHFDEDVDMPGTDAYSPLSSAMRLETNGTVTYRFACLVEGAATNFTGAADAYPKRGNG